MQNTVATAASIEDATLVPSPSNICSANSGNAADIKERSIDNAANPFEA
jgi:hypothetical protein